MATIATPQPRPKPLDADIFEKLLAAGAATILVAMLAALAKGRADWAQVPSAVWAHLATIGIALTLTPIMLLRRRGDTLHRRLGWVWAASLFLTALISLDIRDIRDGRFSFIHILSAWTMIQVPIIVWAARTHRVTRHRASVRGMVLGALLIAGFFTFPFNRMLGAWLFA